MDLGLKPVLNVLKDTRERKREDLVKVNTHSLIVPLCISLPLSLSFPDIDECDDEDTVADCSGGTYCVNKPGSYQCESE